MFQNNTLQYHDGQYNSHFSRVLNLSQINPDIVERFFLIQSKHDTQTLFQSLLHCLPSWKTNIYSTKYRDITRFKMVQTYGVCRFVGDATSLL